MSRRRTEQSAAWFPNSGFTRRHTIRGEGSLQGRGFDLTALTKAYFERIGQAETTKLFMDLAAGQFPNYPDGNTDNTHLQETGARIIGRLAMADAYQQGLRLATFLSAVPVAP